MMKYRLECLTPVLVGDGSRLGPVDYMVWRNQVNVLDQLRIFRLLAKGPRLDNYLIQLKRAQKLDFATWGGFAQNFPDRRIPFEHESAAAIWDQAQGDSLFIPTFASSAAGPYLPGTAIKGALRTCWLGRKWKDGMPQPVREAFQDAAGSRNPAVACEEKEIGPAGASRMRPFAVTDSSPASSETFRVYLIRTATLQAPRSGQLELGWKSVGGRAVPGAKPELAAPYFAEMAGPGTAFSGGWNERPFLLREEIRRNLRWREAPSRSALFEAANAHAAHLLEFQADFARLTGLSGIAETVERLRAEVENARAAGNACVLCVGYGGGFITKSAFAEKNAATTRELLRNSPIYGRVLATGLPFPKTRKIVFLENKPATLPGWVRLQVDE